MKFIKPAALMLVTSTLFMPLKAMCAQISVEPLSGVKGTGMTAAAAAGIKGFTGGWGKGSGSSAGIRAREFEFTAYMGQYDGGDWNSTISTVGGSFDPDKINNGSLPNLLAYISDRSKGKIKTNHKNVKAINLSSSDIFSLKPPFIFLTGSKDFVLTEPEVENLRKYVSLGGAIWGDSAKNSLFEIAFRREMKRVLPDRDKDWEELPINHPIFSSTAYFSEVKVVPPGLGFLKEPVYCLKIYGEIAVICTANDYGNMWQLDPNQKSINNAQQPAVETTYKFGVNLIIHLLTRWESKVKSAISL
jgi:hypothetical protein